MSVRPAFYVLLAFLAGVAASPTSRAQSVLRTHRSPTATGGGFFGSALAAPGDVDGDGVPDLLVGAWREGDEVGRAHVFSGATGAVIRTLTPPQPEPSMYLGFSVAGAGDVDGDGRADLLVGAYGASPGSAPNGAGRAYVFSGATGGVLLTLVSPNQQQSGSFGYAVARLGDVNGDGRPDFVVGSSERTGESPNGAGRAYIVSGADGSALHTLASPNEEFGGGFGSFVAGIGDVDGDAVPDVAIGAQRENPGTNPVDSGAVYAYSGATGARLYTLVDPTPSYPGYFGQSIHGLGDVDDDGRVDFVVGPSEGRAYVFSGADGHLLHTLSHEGGSRTFVASVGDAGDIDGDGRHDAFVGDHTWSRQMPFPTYTFAGRAHVFSGATGALLHTVYSPTLQSYGFFGYAVAGLGDVNGDGRPELAVGAPQQNYESDNQGRVYVFRNFPVSTEPPAPSEEGPLALAPAGPNPGGRERRVRVTVASPLQVRLAVYDVLGREVSVVDAGTLGAGAHEFALGGSSWAPGVYVVRASAGGESATVRLVVR